MPEKIDKLGRTKLMLAVMYQGKTFIAKEIRQNNIFHTDKNGRTALFYAAERGNEEIVWMLLFSLAGTGISGQRGALLKIKDNEGNFAEDWAKIKGREKIGRILSVERQRIEFFE